MVRGTGALIQLTNLSDADIGIDKGIFGAADYQACNTEQQAGAGKSNRWHGHEGDT